MSVFRFRQFDVDDSGCGMKICSDSVLLAAWFLPPYSRAHSLVDAGAGSGVLSLLGAQTCPEAPVYALELDSPAAEACRRNFASSSWGMRMHTVEGDFADFSPPSPVDIIISNPPYFTTGELSADTARAAARHQAGLSYASLLSKAALWLTPDGRLGMVSPAQFENDIIFSAEMSGLKLRRLLRVRTSPRKPVTRLLWDFSPCDGPTDISELSMRDSDGSLSGAYIQLVEPYYLKI
ncbi:MAG: methyltransferase [Muribaculaceae bacterium]|nr:methyltransferase [Muribaculaceae bacterium]